MATSVIDLVLGEAKATSSIQHGRPDCVVM